MAVEDPVVVTSGGTPAVGCQAFDIGQSRIPAMPGPLADKLVNRGPDYFREAPVRFPGQGVKSLVLAVFKENLCPSHK